VKRTVIVSLLLSVALAGCAVWQRMPQAEIDTLAAQSTQVLEGRVLRLGAANVTGLVPTSHTVVIEVTEVFRGMRSMQAASGTEITMLAKDLSGLQPGTSAVFFANGWVLGERVAVKEVGRIVRYDRVALREQVAMAARREALRVLDENLRRADLVVAGTVTAVRDPVLVAAATVRPPLVSGEHDPRLREAVVQVDTVLKGQPRDGTFVLFFPASRDVAWYRVPKFETGQQGVWILRFEPSLQRYLVTKPGDFLPRKRLAEVKARLERGGWL